MKSHVKVGSFGGIVGFYARVLFPRLCSYAYLKYLRIRANRVDRKFIKDALQQKELRPCFIHVETINRCNGSCSFCPCNKYEDKRKLKFMDREVFMKLMDDLETVNYDGIIMLNANCEPFMDKRMPEFIDIVYHKLPRAQKILFTNGTLIDEKILSEIAGKLDTLYVNNYNDKYKLTESSKRIYEYVKKNEFMFAGMKVQIEYRYSKEILTNKGGSAPNKRNTKKIYTELCPNPFLETVVYPDGVVGLCCNDNYEATNYGNIKEDTIYDIFNGEKLWDVRTKMQNGRHGYRFCQYCDFVSKSGRRERWIKTGRD